MMPRGATPPYGTVKRALLLCISPYCLRMCVTVVAGLQLRLGYTVSLSLLITSSMPVSLPPYGHNRHKCSPHGNFGLFLEEESVLYPLLTFTLTLLTLLTFLKSSVCACFFHSRSFIMRGKKDPMLHLVCVWCI